MNIFNVGNNKHKTKTKLNTFAKKKSKTQI